MYTNRKKNGKFSHIGSVINKVLKEYRYEAGDKLAQIRDLWEHIVEKDVAKNARPAAFKGKRIVINVSSSIWMHQLQFSKKDIINKINYALGEDTVEEIKFKIGRV